LVNIKISSIFANYYNQTKILYMYHITFYILSIIYIFGLLVTPSILLYLTEPEKHYNFSNFIDIKKSEDHYRAFFMLSNFLCFLFLNKIREHRKIDYYKNSIIHLDFFEFEKLNSEIKKDYIRMIRYLKLKKIK